MRISSLLLALVGVVALAACSGKSTESSSSTSSSSSSMTTSATTAPSSAASSEIPTYPGATQEASGSSSGAGVTTASGTVLSTPDSFDKVYRWYQSNMPAGSEKSHTAVAGMESAVFWVGNAGDQRSVTITTSGGKTMITIAHVTQ